MGIDLYEFVRGDRPWAQLYRFLVRLPVHGHFHNSVMSDPESVELISKQLANGDKGRPKQTMLGWSFEVSLLATIIDVLSEMHATLAQAHSKDGKRPHVEHIERPTSLADKAEAQLAIIEHRRRVKAWTRQGG